MQIIKNCWHSIGAFDCQYGAHVFDGSVAKIYVNQWLAPSKELYELFWRKNEEGFAGHCLLVFEGVKTFDFSVSLLEKKGDDGKPVWSDPLVSHYASMAMTGTTKYELEGSLHGFSSSVSIVIEAQGFALHILGKDEPAQQS